MKPSMTVLAIALLASACSPADGAPAATDTILKSYDGADPEIEEFIETYRNRGPERGQCPY